MGVRAVAIASKFGAKNCTHQFSARNREIYRMYIGDFRAGEFQYTICARNWGLFHTNNKVFGVGEFKYAIQNFKGAKGVAMATKFRQK